MKRLKVGVVSQTWVKPKGRNSDARVIGQSQANPPVIGLVAAHECIHGFRSAAARAKSVQSNLRRLDEYAFGKTAVWYLP
jgi:hypothetical protein